jgi:hypothetical protein
MKLSQMHENDEGSTKESNRFQDLQAIPFMIQNMEPEFTLLVHHHFMVRA